MSGNGSAGVGVGKLVVRVGRGPSVGADGSDVPVAVGVAGTGVAVGVGGARKARETTQTRMAITQTASSAPTSHMRLVDGPGRLGERP